MKKIISVLLSISIIYVFFGCGGFTSSLEKENWILKTAVVIENGEARVFASDKENDAYPSARIISVVLKASNGKITITDLNKNENYGGTYSYAGASNGAVYEVTFGNKNGFLISTFTEYDDGNKVPTVTLNVENYTLYFYAE